jgi:hypothetical protein
MNTGTAGHLIASFGRYALLCKNATRTMARTAVRHDAVFAHTRCFAVAPQPLLFLKSFE